MSRPARSLLIVLILTLSVPALASAQSSRREMLLQKRAERLAQEAANNPESNQPNGNGLGAGGVPALRDAVVLIEGRTTVLENDLASLAGRVGDLETLVEGLGTALDALETEVGGIDDRLAVIEELATDNDFDGFSEIDGDCDDSDPAVSPLEAEIPANLIDDDCDFLIDEV